MKLSNVIVEQILNSTVVEDYAEILTDFFENMYNQLTCIKTFDPKGVSGYEDDFDVFKNNIPSP